MGSIFHIIKEERQRLNEAQHAYAAAIRREEQGAPQIKQVGRRQYLYLAQRHGPKICFRYIGNVGDPNSQRVLDSIKRRREYQELLREVKSDLLEIKRALHGH
jgi:hypothetical protein